MWDNSHSTKNWQKSFLRGLAKLSRWQLSCAEKYFLKLRGLLVFWSSELQNSSVKWGNTKDRGNRDSLKLPADADFVCHKETRQLPMLRAEVYETLCRYPIWFCFMASGLPKIRVSSCWHVGPLVFVTKGVKCYRFLDKMNRNKLWKFDTISHLKM
jgi:hypothetical protein